MDYLGFSQVVLFLQLSNIVLVRPKQYSGWELDCFKNFLFLVMKCKQYLQGLLLNR